MGRVVEATDHRLGRVVALKQALTTDQVSLLRFEREMRITARLEHPSIVPLYDAGTTADGTPFYAMRKVSGRPLDQLVTRAATLDERLALLSNVLAAAQAIAHAHSRGVLHRDLKPSNILVGSLGETVVIDWGLAKVLDDDDDDEPNATPTSADSLQTRAGTVLGTPGFMSPEQRRGERVDARSDVYALGATLYYVLARKSPHGQDAGPPEPLHQVVAGVPRELETIVEKALAADSAARYLDAGGFAEDLQQFLKGQLVASHRYSRGERVVRFLRRHRLPVAIASVAFASIVIVAWLAVSRVIDARDRAAAALAESRERNELLVLERARELVGSNPTLAVALVKPLATKHWREARAIGLAATVAGVARSLPGSPRTMSLEIARDGVHAVAGGNDGVIRYYDLANGVTRVLARFPERMHVKFADADRRVVTYYDHQLATVHIESGSVRAVPAPTRIASLRGLDDAIWIVGHDGSVWRLAFDDSPAKRIDLADQIWLIEASPDGAMVALGGENALWLVRRGEPAISLARGRTEALAWSQDGSELLAAVADHVLEIAPGTGRVMADRTYRGARAIAFHRGAIYVGAERRVTRLVHDAELDIAIEGNVNRLVLARDDALLAVSDADAFTLITDQVAASIPPTSALDAVTASSRGSFVIGGSDGRLLVWNVDAVLPREILSSGIDNFTLLASGDLLVHAGVHSVWLDPSTGAKRPVELPTGALVGAANANGDVVVLERSTGRAFVVDHDASGGTPLAGTLAVAAFPDRDTIVGGTTDGEVREYRRPQLAPRVLGSARTRGTTIDVQSNAITLALADSSAARFELPSGRLSRLDSDAERLLVAVPGGETLVTRGREVLRWRRTGDLVHHATLDAPSYGDARLIDAHHALFGTADTGASLVDVDRRDRVTVRFAPGSRLADWSFAGGFMLARGAAGKLMMADLFAAGVWQVARPTRGEFGHAKLANDGRRAYAVVDGALLMWTFAIPDATATHRFLESLTDATASTTGTLLWP